MLASVSPSPDVPVADPAPKARAKQAAKRFLARPENARRARRVADAQVRAAHKILNFAQRVDHYVRSQPDPDLDAIELHARMLRSYYDHLRKHVATLPLQPTISILVPVYRPDPAYLREALASIALQVYPQWQACIVDDASGDPAVTAVIEEFRATYPDRVKVAVHEVNQHISATSNTALALADGDYVALLDHDDRLYPQALAEVVKAINTNQQLTGSEPEVMYSDERVVGPEGELFYNSWFKPGWSWYLHLSTNYTNHFTVYRRALLVAIGGFRVGFEGAQDHDLMLRAVDAAETPVLQIPLVLYQWRSHPGSTAGEEGGEAKPYSRINGMRAVQEAAARHGKTVEVDIDPFTDHYRLSFSLPEPRPRVSVVIPTKDRPDLVRGCVSSIFERSTYPDIEVVLVDNGSTDPRTVAYYEQLQASEHQVRVVFDPEYFNFARLNNTGARAASGEYLVLLNNDTEVVAPDWIEQMLMYAQFDDVGAVGAKLLYPDQRIQHAGIVGVGAHIADHTAMTIPNDHHFLMDLPHVVHEAVAVTGAAVMVKASDYAEVGGLDERFVPNGYGDVDFCLRLRALGKSVVYTPYAVLIHYESVSRRRNVELSETQYMRNRWGAELLNDPYLNPNLVRGGQYNQDMDLIQPEIDQSTFATWLANGSTGGSEA